MIPSFTRNYRLLSAPFDLYFAGWFGNSRRLASEGWEFAVEENAYDLSYTLALQHRDLKIRGYSHPITHEFLLTSSRLIPNVGGGSNGPIPVRLAFDVLVDGRRSFEPVDMSRPMWSPLHESAEMVSIKTFFKTYTPTPADKQIILDEMSMDQVLKLALQKQQPAQEQIRKEMLKREQMKKMLEEGSLPSELKAELRVFT